MYNSLHERRVKKSEESAMHISEHWAVLAYNSLVEKGEEIWGGQEGATWISTKHWAALAHDSLHETERREKKAEEGTTCISTKHRAALAYDSLQARRVEESCRGCYLCFQHDWAALANDSLHARKKKAEHPSELHTFISKRPTHFTLQHIHASCMYISCIFQAQLVYFVQMKC